MFLEVYFINPGDKMQRSNVQTMKFIHFTAKTCIYVVKYVNEIKYRSKDCIKMVQNIGHKLSKLKIVLDSIGCNICINPKTDAVQAEATDPSNNPNASFKTILFTLSRIKSKS